MWVPEQVTHAVYEGDFRCVARVGFPREGREIDKLNEISGLLFEEGDNSIQFHQRYIAYPVFGEDS
jgi:hypothetical protein